ncbi:unnamed protein product [Discula destructiva]
MLTTAPHLQVRRPSPTTAEFTVTTCPAPSFSNRLLFVVVFILRILFALAVLILLHSTWPLSSPFHNDPAAATIGVATPTTPTILAATTYTHGHDGNMTTMQIEADAASAVVAAEAIDPSTTAHQQQHPSLAALPTPIEPPSTLLTPAWLPYALARLHATRPGISLAALGAATPSSLLVPLCIALLYATTLRIHTTESLLVLRGLGIQTSSTGGSFLASWRAGTRFIPTEKIRDVLINEAFRGFGVRYYLVVVVDGEDDVVVVFPRLLPGRAVVEKVWRGVRGCLWEPQDGVGGGGGGGGGKRWEEKSTSG